MKKTILLLSAFATIAFAEQAPPNVDHSTSGCTMSWDGVAGFSYFLLSSTDLMSWTYFDSMEYGTGSYGYGFVCSESKMFVRLAYVNAPWVTTLQEAKDADFDGDGIPNIFELEDVGSDPLDKESAGGDSDSDGLNDGWEQYYFGNLSTADPNAIVSGDGITNKEKSDLGLDPNTNYNTSGSGQNTAYTYDLAGRISTITGSSVSNLIINMDEEGNIITAQ